MSMSERFKLAANVLLSRRLSNLLQIDETVEIDREFITCAEYQLFIDEMRAAGKNRQPDHWKTWRFTPGDAKKPILGVRGSDAEEFCEWLTKQHPAPGVRYRLPTIAEAEEHPATDKQIGCWCKDADKLVIAGIDPAQWQAWQQKLSEVLILNNVLNSDLNSILNRDLNSVLNRDLYCVLYCDLNNGLNSDLNRVLKRDMKRDLDSDLDYILNSDLNRVLNHVLKRDMKRVLYSDLDSDFYRDLKSVLNRDLYSDLYSNLYRLLNSALYNDLYQILDSVSNCADLNSDLKSVLKRVLNSDPYSDLYRLLDSALKRDLDSDFNRVLKRDLDSDFNRVLKRDLYSDLNRVLNSALNRKNEANEVSDLLLLYFPLVFVIVINHLLSEIYEQVSKNRKALKSVKLGSKQCKAISIKYAYKRDEVFPIYAFLVLLDERKQGRMPVWEGIRIVRERVE